MAPSATTKRRLPDGRAPRAPRVGRGPLLDAADLSVVLQDYLEAVAEARPLSPERIRAILSRPATLAALHRELSPAPEASLTCLLDDTAYLTRLCDIVEERHRIGGSAPTLRVAPLPLTPMDARRFLPGDINLALLFSAETVLFQDTLHALANDAAAEWQRADAPGVNVLGVRLDWRTRDHRCAARALVVDETGLVEEAAFEEPVSIHVAHVLHLRRDDERSVHARVSRECRAAGIVEINPHDAASRADDKWATHELWRRHLPLGRADAPVRVDAPRAWLVPRSAGPGGARELVSRALAEGRPVYIQPRHGTEGRLVARFEPREADAAAEHVAAILRSDDALVREERGNVGFGEAGTPPRRLALRVHVAWDGRRFVAESGFAQVAGDDAPRIASRGRGGAIVDIGEALANLWRRDGDRWRRAPIASEDIVNLRAGCEAAAEALNAGLAPAQRLKHMGLDVMLEWTRAGALLPVLLEANARPAGLNCSRWLPDAPCDRADLGVSRALFAGGASWLETFAAIRSCVGEAASAADLPTSRVGGASSSTCP